VSDTGIGIDGDKMNMLFKSFSQVDSSITENMEVQAWTCNFKTACRDDGWRNLGRESKGKGSTFYFTAGFKRKAKSSVKAECTSNADERVLGRKLNILLAEDDKVNQQVIAGMLKKEQCSLTIAENGLRQLNSSKKMSLTLY